MSCLDDTKAPLYMAINITLKLRYIWQLCSQAGQANKIYLTIYKIYTNMSSTDCLTWNCTVIKHAKLCKPSEDTAYQHTILSFIEGSCHSFTGGIITATNTTFIFSCFGI